jgi:hypothetical protein
LRCECSPKYPRKWLAERAANPALFSSNSVFLDRKALKQAIFEGSKPKVKKNNAVGNGGPFRSFRLGLYTAPSGQNPKGKIPARREKPYNSGLDRATSSGMLSPLLLAGCTMFMVMPCAGAVPADWQQKIAGADALYSADDRLPWRSQAGLGNGLLGTAISSGLIHLSGVYSNSTRASLVTDYPSATLSGPGLEPAGALLDIRSATYTRRQASTKGGQCAYTTEQRWYAHRARPSLFVMELDIASPCDCEWNEDLELQVGHNCTDGTEGCPTTSETLNITEKSRPGSTTVAVGTTAFAEGQGRPLPVAVVRTTLPKTLRVPFSSRTRCENTSLRYVLAVRSSLSVPGGANASIKAVEEAATAGIIHTVLTRHAPYSYVTRMYRALYTILTRHAPYSYAILIDYGDAMAIANTTLHAQHVEAWGEIWQAGLEVGGRTEAAVAVNTSLYTVISSLRDDWPYSCCGTGLYSNGWDGHAFWDCEMWHEPSLLLLHPAISRSMRAYRAVTPAASTLERGLARLLCRGNVCALINQGVCVCRLSLSGAMYSALYTHALIHSCTIHSCTHTLMHSYTHALIHACTHALMHSCTHTLMHSYTHALMHSCTHALMHSCTHTLIHSCTHVLMHTHYSRTHYYTSYTHRITQVPMGKHCPWLPGLANFQRRYTIIHHAHTLLTHQPTHCHTLLSHTAIHSSPFIHHAHTLLTHQPTHCHTLLSHTVIHSSPCTPHIPPPPSAIGHREVHISSDVAFAFQQYYYATRDRSVPSADTVV